MKAHLSISSYAGIVAGASHYMGTLRIGSEEHTVEGTLTRADCLKFNKQCREDGDPYRYKVGGKSSRFHTEEGLIATAVALAKEKGVTLLLRGSHCVLDPQQVLLGPEPLMTELNAIYAEAEANDGWEGDEKVMEEISQRWEAALKAAGY